MSDLLNKLPWVNLLQGTRSVHDFSTGNTLPLVARPWGMHHWTLQTGKAPWTFHGDSRRLWGVRLTHQPSPWMQEYGSLMLQPFHGDLCGSPDLQASAYDPEMSVLTPCYLKTELMRYGITLEMSPTDRGALFRFKGRADEKLKIRFDFDSEHELKWMENTREICGYSADAFEGEDLINFRLYFSGEFSEVPESFERSATGGHLVFPHGVKQVDLRLAGSFIGHEFTRETIRRELSLSKSLEMLANEGAMIWNDLLNRIEIREKSEEQAETFYSCLYRCLLFPRFLDEIDVAGKVVHFSPYDGKVHEGSLCADAGFWDTYRTVNPLMTLVYPDVQARMMEGWLNVCRESGWSPKWASPGARRCMIGTHFDVTVADMVVKGITDWNVEEVYSYLWRDATEPATCGRFGRLGLEEYMSLGYVAADRAPYAVASTMDYAYDDFCVAQVAAYLGKNQDAELLRKRSGNYRNLFDPSAGFMRARNSDGSWHGAFREFEWGGPYIEGGAWQHSFNIPHDVPGMIELWGGEAAFCRKLDQMLATPPTFETGSYGREIHEMTEMAAASFGQYAHSNQPVHNYLFLFAQAGEPEKTGYWVRRILEELYSPDAFPGDEDNGEMSAWYIWGCLGLYPVCPGRPEYLKFKPGVVEARIRIPGHREIFIEEESWGSAGLVSHVDLLNGVVGMTVGGL